MSQSHSTRRAKQVYLLTTLANIEHLTQIPWSLCTSVHQLGYRSICRNTQIPYKPLHSHNVSDKQLQLCSQGFAESLITDAHLRLQLVGAAEAVEQLPQPVGGVEEAQGHRLLLRRRQPGEAGRLQQLRGKQRQRAAQHAVHLLEAALRLQLQRQGQLQQRRQTQERVPAGCTCMEGQSQGLGINMGFTDLQ